MSRTATHCNTLQHTATHCNTHIQPPKWGYAKGEEWADESHLWGECGAGVCVCVI